jgi:3-oxoacyl-[acyl-carrier protein] reductase
MDAMTRSLAIEWADRGVRVNGVAPGYIATDMTHGMRENDVLKQSLLDTVPMARFAHPEEVGAVIAFLASDAASYITGQTIIVDGGARAPLLSLKSLLIKLRRSSSAKSAGGHQVRRALSGEG